MPPTRVIQGDKIRYAGLDYLRVILSLFVVLWHLDGTDRSLLFFPGRADDHSFGFSDLLNFHFLLLAVPGFILISNFLYARKEVNRKTLRKITGRILVLYTFWPIAYTIFKYGHEGLSRLKPGNFEETLIELASAGSTIYYFFFSLLITTLLAHVAARSTPKIQVVGFILALCIQGIAPFVAISNNMIDLCAYWNPINFLPYPFAACLIAKNFNYFHSKRFLFSGLALGISAILALLEWHYLKSEVFFPGQGFSFPAYTRPSLLFASLGILLPLLDRRINIAPFIKKLSGFSLALYCLHPFINRLVAPFVAQLVKAEEPSHYLTILPVIVLSYIAAAILKRFYFQKRLLT